MSQAVLTASLRWTASGSGRRQCASHFAGSMPAILSKPWNGRARPTRCSEAWRGMIRAWFLEAFTVSPATARMAAAEADSRPALQDTLTAVVRRAVERSTDGCSAIGWRSTPIALSTSPMRGESPCSSPLNRPVTGAASPSGGSRNARSKGVYMGFEGLGHLPQSLPLCTAQTPSAWEMENTHETHTNSEEGASARNGGRGSKMTHDLFQKPRAGRSPPGNASAVATIIRTAAAQRSKRPATVVAEPRATPRLMALGRFGFIPEPFRGARRLMSFCIVCASPTLRVRTSKYTFDVHVRDDDESIGNAPGCNDTARPSCRRKLGGKAQVLPGLPPPTESCGAADTSPRRSSTAACRHRPSECRSCNADVGTAWCGGRGRRAD